MTEDRLAAAAIGAFEESAAVQLAFIQKEAPAVAAAARRLAEVFRAGGRLFLFGNGGSAADAQHIAGEFVNRFLLHRPGLPALALTTNGPLLTSIANDEDFSEVFARQIQALGRPGDAALAISTSGRSPNVLKAVEAARAADLVTLGFTGGDGGELARLVHYAFVVPSTSTPRIQETHITLGHVICEAVERILFAGEAP